MKCTGNPFFNRKVLRLWVQCFCWFSSLPQQMSWRGQRRASCQCPKQSARTLLSSFKISLLKSDGFFDHVLICQQIIKLSSCSALLKFMRLSPSLRSPFLGDVQHKWPHAAGIDFFVSGQVDAFQQSEDVLDAEESGTFDWASSFWSQLTQTANLARSSQRY